MPVYACTLKEGGLPAPTKKALAIEIGTIHSAINHVPSTYVNVVFNELPADSVYTDGVPASPFLVNGWVREGHPKAETTRWPPKSRRRLPGLPASRPSGCSSCSKAVRQVSPSKAVVCCRSPARKQLGSPASRTKAEKTVLEGHRR